MTPEERKEKQRVRSKRWYEKNKKTAIDRAKAWKKENTDKVKICNKNYRIKNKKSVKEKSARWAKENPEKGRAKTARYARKYPERVRERSAKYKRNNPEKVKSQKQNRRARVIENGGEISHDHIKKLILFQKNKCFVCRLNFKKNGFHVDHIVPLSRGGKNDNKNIQLLCPICNHKKHAKDPIKFMQEMGYLL